MELANLFTASQQRPCRITLSQAARPKDSSESWRRMYLQTDPLPLTHIKECFGDSYAIVRGSPEWTSEYNRCLEFVDGFPKSFKNFVQLLSEVLCLPADEPCRVSCRSYAGDISGWRIDSGE